jgi:hypothetical protein
MLEKYEHWAFLHCHGLSIILSVLSSKQMFADKILLRAFRKGINVASALYEYIS